MQRRDWRFCFPPSPDSRRESAVVQLSTLDGAHHDMLCEICHQREATCHINTIKDGVVTSRDLCDDCFAASNPTQAHELTTALKAGCRYCGGEPYTGSGSGHSLAELSTTKLSFMCKPCAEEYFRFVRQRLPSFGDPDITNGQIAELRTHNIGEVLTEAKEHMKKWVAEKVSK